ncbi:MAG: hypothetical protein D6744_00600 [Planctomycetota bacterium]|nr:MAG: hypothetical protein D6744_00600 [Planctomycetota bacterium]
MRTAVACAVGLALCLPCGTLCHELLGHGLTGVLLGGRITELHVLGVDLWPRPRWVGWQGYYGWCGVEGLSSDAADAWMGLAGSASTWLVAAVASVALWLRRWRGVARVALVCASLWWIDAATYLLPAFGLKRSILWGGDYAEPYECAMRLGADGPLFLAVVYAGSGLMAAALVWRLATDRPPAAAAKQRR